MASAMCLAMAGPAWGINLSQLCGGAGDCVVSANTVVDSAGAPLTVGGNFTVNPGVLLVFTVPIEINVNGNMVLGGTVGAPGNGGSGGAAGGAGQNGAAGGSAPLVVSGVFKVKGSVTVQNTATAVAEGGQGGGGGAAGAGGANGGNGGAGAAGGSLTFNTCSSFNSAIGAQVLVNGGLGGAGGTGATLNGIGGSGGAGGSIIINAKQGIVSNATMNAEGGAGGAGSANGTAGAGGTISLNSGSSISVGVGTLNAGTNTPSVNQNQASIAALSFCAEPAPAPVSIGGTVSGLAAGNGLVLKPSWGNAFTISANGSFRVPTQIDVGRNWTIAIQSQPAAQTCTVTNGAGYASSDVSNVAVSCSNNLSIGGTVTGLLAGRSLVLRNNWQDDLAITANGPFTFATLLPPGSIYAVTIASQPVGQKCEVNRAWDVASANVTNITVVCPAFDNDVAQLYVALFGRAPERGGFDFWVLLRSAGVSHVAVANLMFYVEPARNFYPFGASRRDIVAAFYKNVLGRTANTNELDFWTARLEVPGATPGSVIAELISTVVNYTGSDPAGLTSMRLFNNRAEVALYYAQKGGSLNSATAVLRGVTEDPQTVVTTKRRIDSGELR